MVDRDADAARIHAAARGRLRGIAVGAVIGAILGAMLSAGVALAGRPTRADAVITALALEQGRHCVVTRAADAHVIVRGDACDGRLFIRAIVALLTSADAKASPSDLDLDIDIKTLDGFNGETLRDVTFRLSVQRGAIAAFALAARLGGQDVSGGLGAAADHRPTIHLEADDAGAFLRWAGLYRHVRGGALTIAMYAPNADGVIDDGVARLRAFEIADDPALRSFARMLSVRGRAEQTRFAFVRLRVAFKSQAGRVTFSDGVLTGEPMGATLGGTLDLAQNRLDLRGAIVPTIQFSQVLPIFFPREFGLIGSDYTISGPASAPVLRINPLATLEPGILRKLFMLEPRDHNLEP